ncbi:hypothetical protein EI94DRAFT_1701157 [Lactarius quietus]|nr:hypothetical protein EI94DRAFT_1701157 [Lactarius quietus]
MGFTKLLGTFASCYEVVFQVQRCPVMMLPPIYVVLWCGEGCGHGHTKWVTMIGSRLSHCDNAVANLNALMTTTWNLTTTPKTRPDTAAPTTIVRTTPATTAASTTVPNAVPLHAQIANLNDSNPNACATQHYHNIQVVNYLDCINGQSDDNNNKSDDNNNKSDDNNNKSDDNNNKSDDNNNKSDDNSGGGSHVAVTQTANTSGV